jgi:hypothetical protein
MTLDEIASAGRAIERISNRLGGLLEEKTGEDLARVRYIMQEVRLFADSWAESDDVGRDLVKMGDALDAKAAAREYREQATTRLIDFIRPVA